MPGSMMPAADKSIAQDVPDHDFHSKGCNGRMAGITARIRAIITRTCGYSGFDASAAAGSRGRNWPPALPAIPLIGHAACHVPLVVDTGTAAANSRDNKKCAAPMVP
jgi:hypothetical protein